MELKMRQAIRQFGHVRAFIVVIMTVIICSIDA